MPLMCSYCRSVLIVVIFVIGSMQAHASSAQQHFRLLPRPSVRPLDFVEIPSGDAVGDNSERNCLLPSARPYYRIGMPPPD